MDTYDAPMFAVHQTTSGSDGPLTTTAMRHGTLTTAEGGRQEVHPTLLRHSLGMHKWTNGNGVVLRHTRLLGFFCKRKRVQWKTDANNKDMAKCNHTGSTRRRRKIEISGIKWMASPKAHPAILLLNNPGWGDCCRVIGHSRHPPRAPEGGGVGLGPGALRDVGKNRLFRASGAGDAPSHPPKTRPQDGVKSAPAWP